MKKILAAVLLGAVLRGACAPQAPAQPESAAPAEPSQSADPSAPADGGLEFQTEKIIPGCRSTLAHPLKMHGESDAVDFSRWTASDLDGRQVNQDILKESRLTLVNIWATFCGGHVEDLTVLQTLYASIPREDLNVAGILASAQSPDGSLNEDEIGYVKYLLDMTGAQYPQILPSDDLIQIRLKDLGTIPQSFLLDSEGNMVGEPWTGSRTEEELRGMIEAALRETERS